MTADWFQAEAALRIGIISHLKYAIREPFAGGLEMHTHLLATKLIERGNDVHVFCAEGSTVPGAVPICPPTAALTNDNAADAICNAREHRAYLQIMNHLRNAQFDAIHNNSLHYLPLDMAGVCDLPMMTLLHTPPFDPLAPAAANASHHQHPFVAVSDVLSSDWAERGVASIAIPNGIDLSRFAFSAAPALTPYAVWSGRFVPEKGAHLAIQAARIAGIDLRLAGPIHDPDYFQNHIAPALGANVRYEGHLDHAQLTRLVGGAQVFLCSPLWEEPYGLVVAEALACGVPVAAFARGAIPRILNATCGALATPDDPMALAEATLIARRLSRAACRRRAELVCDVEVMIDRYVDLYSELAGIVPDTLIPPELQLASVPAAP